MPKSRGIQPLAATGSVWLHESRWRSSLYAPARYSCQIRASLARTDRAADSKPRRFVAEQGMCVPMLAAEAKIRVDSDYRTVLLRMEGAVTASLLLCD